MVRRLPKYLIFSMCLCARVLFCTSFLFARPSKSGTSIPKKEAADILSVGDEFSTSTENTSSSEEKVKIAVPSAKRTYFSKIPQNIMDGIETGSPSSIKQALSILRKSESEYSETERVLINVAASIMQMAWPSQKISIEVPSFSEQTSYIGALNLAREGFFDSSTGNTDFLSTLLPAMVLLYKGDLSDTVLSQCEAAVLEASSFREFSILSDYLKGVLLTKRGNYPEAEQIFSNLYASYSDVYEISVACIDSHLRNGKNEQAFAKASVLRQKYPMDVTVLNLSAKSAFALKKLDIAEEYVAYILQQNPNNLEFVLFRARILTEKGDYIHAVSLLDMYARQNDTNADYLLLRAKVQIEWNKSFVQAAEVVEKALSLYPQNQEAMLLAAQIASVTDSPVGGKYADELVEKILEKDPENEQALIYAMNGLARREAWQSAYEISRKLVNGGNRKPEVVSEYVEICLKLGKTGEALSLANQAYKENPNDDVILQTYILAQVSGGNKTQSLNLINSLLETSSSKVKSFLYYRRSFLQPNESAVLADLRSSMIANPRNSDALFRLYEIYFEKKDYKKAQYYLKQVVALNPNDSSIKKLNESLTKLLQ
ncbi:MAG: hypothetical protein HUK25_06085 [Treponema sp.]|nr:hypothetical protein [Treponema sp.]